MIKVFIDEKTLDITVIDTGDDLVSVKENETEIEITDNQTGEIYLLLKLKSKFDSIDNLRELTGGFTEEDVEKYFDVIHNDYPSDEIKEMSKYLLLKQLNWF